MSIIGHENTKKQLEVAMSAARKMNMALPHMLFSGAAGCGKTSLARYIASKSESDFLSVVPNDMKDYDSIMKILDRLDLSNYDESGNRIGKISPTILFLDEVHNLPLKGQEILGIVMERFMVESNIPNKYYWVPFFTIIGATTLAGKLSKPFRDRFKLMFSFQPYEFDDMVRIVQYHAMDYKIMISLAGAKEVAKRSRGTPRIAVGYIERIRDRMISIGSEMATTHLIKETFKDMNIDDEGLTTLETRILKILFDSSKPISLDNLSTILQEDSKSIKDFAEPFLIRKGFILISGKGRIITEKGIQHLNNSGKAGKLVKKEIDFNYERF
jgi:Holliday junction DNA helicase RuvB